MSQLRRILPAVAVLSALVCGVPSNASANVIFTLTYTPSPVNINSPGLYVVNIHVQPQFAPTGFFLAVDPTSVPKNVVPILLFPVGFFVDARNSQDVTMLLLVLPGAPNGARTMSIKMTQFRPPFGNDTVVVPGPSLNVNIPPG